MKSCVWISSISDIRLEVYLPAMKTWATLPGRKILFLDGQQTEIEGLEIVDFWSIADKDCNWLKEFRGTKAHRFWFKGYSLYYSLKNLNEDLIIWIDADVFVEKAPDIELLDIGNHLFSTMYFKCNVHNKPDHVAETGLQIFNNHHQDIKKYADEYIDYWESLKLYNLYRGYDGYVTGDLIPKYDFVNMVTENHEDRIPLENTFKYTKFKDHLIHYLGIENKDKLRDLK